jgi:hypothetical protein
VNKVFAAPAFTNAPSPLKIPLPSFIKNKTTHNPHNNITLGPSLLHLIRPKIENNNHFTTTNNNHDMNDSSHDRVTGLPRSLMHLVLNDDTNSNAPINPPTIVDPAVDFNNNPAHAILTHNPTVPHAALHFPSSAKLLFLRSEEKNNNNPNGANASNPTILTSVPLNPSSIPLLSSHPDFNDNSSAHLTNSLKLLLKIPQS